jgi:hypothetical protein
MNIDFTIADTLINRDYVRLLTYNLFLRPFVRNLDNDWKEERLREFVQVLDDYDIICN